MKRSLVGGTLSCPRCGCPYSKAQDHCGLDGERLQEFETDPLIGRSVDRYKILDRIGDGAMARVYRAEHVFLKQPCAVKILFGEIGANPTSAERFRREARAAGEIRQKNVVQVLDFGTSSEGLTFLAMELAEGMTLREALHRVGTFEPERARDVAKKIASGLGAAHDLGFVHRDLKPANIMLVEEASGEEVAKILDFGLVRSMDDGDATELTRAGHVFGTPAYMAPEQITDAKVGPSADLYALGIITYEIIAGVPPFSGTARQQLGHHLATKPPPLPDCGELAMVVDKLLAKEPENRYVSAYELCDALDRANLGRAPVFKTKTKKRKKRSSQPPIAREPHPWRTIAATLATGMLVVGATAFLARSNTSKPQATKVMRPTGGAAALPAKPRPTYDVITTAAPNRLSQAELHVPEAIPEAAPDPKPEPVKLPPKPAPRSKPIVVEKARPPVKAQPPLRVTKPKRRVVQPPVRDLFEEAERTAAKNRSPAPMAAATTTKPSPAVTPPPPAEAPPTEAPTPSKAELTRRLNDMLSQLRSAPSQTTGSFKALEARWIELQDAARRASLPDQRKQLAAEIGALERAVARWLYNH